MLNWLEESKLLWLIKLRWLALSLFIVFGAVGFLLQGIPTQNISAYIGLTGLLLVFNLLSQVYASPRRVVKPVTICFQLGVDLIILTGFLYYSRGIENPFLALFYLNACLGGLLIPGYLALPFLLLIHGLLAFLQIEYLFSIPGAPNSPPLLISILVSHLLVFGFWLVMRSLGYYFEQQREKQVLDLVMIEKQDRLRALGALSAGFSHEFASPLNTAKLRLQRMARTHAGNDDLNEASLAIEACESIIRQMNAAQVDTRNFIYSIVPLSARVKELVETWKNEHPDAQVDVEVNDVGRVEIPSITFAQVLLNLLDNAWEANPQGRIRVVLKADRSDLWIAVEDSGPGFAASVLEKRGEPFVTTKEHGTGLGLYVSDLFVQSLGGEMTIQNHSSGARVSLKWPQKGAVT